ncbi:exodeoxyribonuclease III [Parvularcula lutaonensis]|uniref:Exodeoxyribonuclease III n=1 Tax=Parvularcula lutaonensis TaxID=491923 RepID=A0ABV7M9K8_9PROT|nr:exodeoxyribonuclease III [Parvularcula lutaonensis]GGY47427.1 exodeoxyribonuclease III [Parvularcula lutaonensis]
MRLVTWNINSVRLRIASVQRFLEEEQPDVLCLQETKCHDDQFPRKAFEKVGYPHLAISGQKGYHGVAIASRVPFEDPDPMGFCKNGDARHIAVTLPGGVRLHNFYVPAGGDIPDPQANDKFAHKLHFVEQMTKTFAKNKDQPRIVVGDLNIAPEENDVWSHKQLLKVVSHTPVETEAMKQLIRRGGFIDVARELIPGDEKVYSWWSYRAKDWAASDRGRRLDHIWVTEPLRMAALAKGREAFRVHRDVRGWERPSDHAPVRLDLDFSA